MALSARARRGNRARLLLAAALPIASASASKGGVVGVEGGRPLRLLPVRGFLECIVSKRYKSGGRGIIVVIIVTIPSFALGCLAATTPSLLAVAIAFVLRRGRGGRRYGRRVLVHVSRWILRRDFWERCENHRAGQRQLRGRAVAMQSLHAQRRAEKKGNGRAGAARKRNTHAPHIVGKTDDQIPLPNLFAGRLEMP